MCEQGRQQVKGLANSFRVPACRFSPVWSILRIPRGKSETYLKEEFSSASNMFKNTFQSGFLSILYSIGSKPLQIWQRHGEFRAAPSLLPPSPPPRRQGSVAVPEGSGPTSPGVCPGAAKGRGADARPGPQSKTDTLSVSQMGISSRRSWRSWGRTSARCTSRARRT